MRRVWCAAVIVPLVALGAGPAAAEQTGSPPADPPGAVEREEVVFAFAYPDADAGIVALGGPPAEQGCFGEGFDDLGTNQTVTTGSGAVVVLGKDVDQPMFVYAGTSIEDVCERVIAGEPVELLASGTVRLLVTDNDRDVSGTRTNTFRNTATGQLQTPDGETCRFQAAYHAQIDRSGELRELRLDASLRC